MKVLLTGKGSSGSWKIRGEQIAEGLRTLGVEAVAVPKADIEVMREADVIVLVKRPTFELMDAIRESRTPFAWDVVDSWPQPEGNEWPKQRALTWLHTMIADVRPQGLICTTRAMLADAEFPKACVIYHHARTHFRRLKPRRSALTYAYEGGAHYLGRYRGALKEANGIIFVEGSVRDEDAVLCLRDCAGYAARHWKSNVKLANAQALGIPALCSPESGYKETSAGGVIWIDSPADLPAAFNTLCKPSEYARLCAEVDEPPGFLEVCERYKAFLESLC